MGIDKVMRSAGFTLAILCDKTESYSRVCNIRDIRKAMMQPLSNKTFQSLDDAVTGLFYGANDTLVFARMYDSVMDFLDNEFAWVLSPASDVAVT